MPGLVWTVDQGSPEPRICTRIELPWRIGREGGLVALVQPWWQLSGLLEYTKRQARVVRAGWSGAETLVDLARPSKGLTD